MIASHLLYEPSRVEAEGGPPSGRARRLRILALPASRPDCQTIRGESLQVSPVVIPKRSVELAAGQAAVLETGVPTHTDIDLCDQASRMNSLLP